MKHTLRIFISFVFTWVQVFLGTATAQAANPVAVKVPAQQMKDFFVQSGLTKKNVRLADFYAKTKSSIPADLRFEIELYLEMNPNAILPKLDIKTVKNGSTEDLQLSFTEKGQSGNLILAMKNGEVGKLSYSLKGKTVTKPMKYRDLVFPVRFMTELGGKGFARSEKTGFAQLLDSKQVAAFKMEDRNRYQNHIRELMEAAEKVQNKHMKRVTANPRKERKTSLLLDRVLSGDPAWAVEGAPKNGQLCLTMGWVGSYKSGICEPPAAAKSGSGNCYVCNPKIYNNSTFCSKTSVEAQAVGETSVGSCNKRFKDVVAKPSEGKVGTAEEIKKFHQESEAKQAELTKQINNLLLLCQEGNIQDKECADLRVRVQELRRENCAYLEDHPEAAGELRCYFDPTDKVQVAEEKSKQDAQEKAEAVAAAKAKADPTGTAAGGAGTDGTPSKETPAQISGEAEQPPVNAGRGEAPNYSACVNLPTSPSDLGCGSDQTRRKICDDGNGPVTYYRCECPPGTGIKQDTVYDVRCGSSGGNYAGSSSPSTRSSYTPRSAPAPKSWWEQGTSSNFLGPMLGLLGFIGITWLMNYQTKQQLAQQYQMLTPQPLAIAPPPVAGAALPTVSSGGAPVIQGR